MVGILLTFIFLGSFVSVCGEPCRITLNDAMGTAMQYQWNIEISKEAVYSQAGILQETAGPFDAVFDGFYNERHLFDAQNPFFALKSHKDGQITHLHLALTKTARLGTVFASEGDILRIHNPMLFPPRTNNYFLSFTVDQPLLRGFYNNTAAVNERIAFLELEAVKGDFVQTVATQLVSVAQAYWDLVAAEKERVIRNEAEARLEKIADSTRKLIEGNQIAPAELNLQLAELSKAKRQREFAEQEVYQAYNTLRLATGQEAICDCSEMPDLDLEEFPQISDATLLPLRRLQEIAVQSRLDFYARQIRFDEANEQVALARNELLPLVNVRAGTVVLNSQIDELARPFFRPVTAPLPEIDTFAEIRVSVPFCNDEARGNYRRRTAERRQSMARVTQLFEQIRLDVATALRDHSSLIGQIRDADNAVKWYQAALDAELRKLKEGYSTLFFVLDYQDRLSTAQSEQNDTYRRYAENIANLLYFTGNLVSSDACSCRVIIANAHSLDPIRNDPIRNDESLSEESL
jgi:outer membrane protein TolC